jgi:AcrR family transcriptional regulator
LLAVGKEKLTTTLVARRAGVSVGTLYQYFPNKRSLLQALLRQHLLRVTLALESACLAQHGQPLLQIVTATADAFFRAKMQEPRASLALYAISSDVDGLRITEDLRRRNEATLEAAIRSSPDRITVDLDPFVFTLQASLIGVARRILEARLPATRHEPLRQQMLALLTAYVHAVTEKGDNTPSERRLDRPKSTSRK